MQLFQLLIRSNYSFLNSTISISDIVKFALSNKHKYAIISDYKKIYSFLEFQDACKKNNLIPIYSFQFIFENSEFLLIAKNINGYKNLLKISNYQTIKEEWIKDLILIHLDGEILFKKKKDYYLANSNCELGVPVRENKFLNNEDYEFFALIQSIKKQTLIEEEKINNEHYKFDFLIQKDCDYKNKNYFKNIEKIINSCEDFEIKIPKNNLNFFNKEFHCVFEEMQKILLNNLKQYQEKHKINIKKYKKRLLQELQLIKNNDFVNYFYMIYDFVNFSHEQKLLIGPGRGSVCGSLVAFLLKITAIDPIKYFLYFERFLNSERVNYPDIDIDVSAKDKKKIIYYLQEKYGKNQVIQTSSIQRFKLKSAIDEIFKSFNLNSKAFLGFVAKNDINNENYKEKLNLLNLKSSKNKNIINLLIKLIKFPKSISTNSVGIIISNFDLINYLSFNQINNCESENLLTTSFSYSGLEKINLIKFDLLPLNFLDLIKNTISLTNKKININQISFDDENVFNLIGKGYNSGLFQLEGQKINEIVSEYKPKNIFEMSNILSLIRPGAFKQIKNFLNIRNKKASPQIINEKINDFLFMTDGLLLYQEQVMEIVSKITQCSFDKSDLYRLAIAKKNKFLLEKLKFEFFALGIKNNFLKEELNKIWSYIYGFGSFGFNKSHSIAYSCLLYQTAWLKTNFSAEFFVSLIKLFGFKKEYIKEIYQTGHTIKIPKINNFFNSFYWKNKTIYIPLLKNIYISENLKNKLKKILENQKFKHLYKCIFFLIDNEIDRDEIKSLNYLGFFNSLFIEGENQLFLEKNLDLIYENYLFYKDEGGKGFYKNLKTFSESLEDKNFYIFKKNEYCGFELLKQEISNQTYISESAISLIFIKNQKNEIQKYLGFFKSIKKATFYTNKLSYLITIFSTNYDEIEIIYCGKFENEYFYYLNKNKVFVFEIKLNKKCDKFYEINN